MPWSPFGPDQVVVLALTALAVAGFVAACIRHDLRQKETK